MSLGGLVLTVIGIFRWRPSYSGNYISYKYFGGDAYTEIQHAIVDLGQTVNNVGYFLSETAQYCFVIVGILVAVVGCYLFASAIFSYAKSLTPAVKSADSEG